MKNKKLSSINAVKLRIILVAVLLLIALVGTAAAYFIIGYLDTYAKEVNTVVVKAEESNGEVSRIEQLSQRLNQNRSSFEKAKQVVAESKGYKYQNVIIDDIKKMAAQAQVSITSFDFTSETPTGAASQSGAKKSATAPTPQPAAGGLKSTTAVVTLAGPVEYSKVLNFMHYVEQNLTKMQITDTVFSQYADDPKLLDQQQIKIEVYIE